MHPRSRLFQAPTVLTAIQLYHFRCVRGKCAKREGTNSRSAPAFPRSAFASVEFVFAVFIFRANSDRQDMSSIPNRQYSTVAACCQQVVRGTAMAQG